MAHSSATLAAGLGAEAMELLISRKRDLERERDGRGEREEDRKGEGDWGLEERKGVWRRAIGEGKGGNEGS